VDSSQIFRETFFRFHKKKQKGKEKVVIQGEDRKSGCKIPYKWGYVEIIIRRSKLKVAKVVVEVSKN
jgi:hypothetical protein